MPRYTSGGTFLAKRMFSCRIYYSASRAVTDLQIIQSSFDMSDNGGVDV
jgi:hypothetical protein